MHLLSKEKDPTQKKDQREEKSFKCKFYSNNNFFPLKWKQKDEKDDEDEKKSCSTAYHAYTYVCMLLRQCKYVVFFLDRHFIS